MRIAVVGLWHLGTVRVACLASVEHSVTAIDPEPSVIVGLQVGELPVQEPELAQMIEAQVRSGNLRSSSQVEVVAENDVAWVTFDAPVGGTANASHALNDFRKLAGMEGYAPTNNVSELTARANEAWLRVSWLRPDDLLLVLSIGGGDVQRRGTGLGGCTCLRMGVRGPHCRHRPRPGTDNGRFVMEMVRTYDPN